MGDPRYVLVAEDGLDVLEFLRELQEDDFIVGVSKKSIWPFKEALGPDVCKLRILDEEEGILL